MKRYHETYQAKIWGKANRRQSNWPYTQEWLTLHYGCYHYAIVAMKQEEEENGIVSVYGVIQRVLNHQFTVKQFAIFLFWAVFLFIIIFGIFGKPAP
jgi:hypothetical protein